MTQTLQLGFWLCLLAGCGEVASVSLVNRPEREAFPEIREILLTVGCSGDDRAGGCHAVVVGDLQISIEEPPAQQLEEEFLQIKAIVDLDAPEESRVLTVAAPPDPDDPEPVGHSICFDAGGACADSKLLAWISGEAPGDTECVVETNTCHF